MIYVQYYIRLGGVEQNAKGQYCKCPSCAYVRERGPIKTAMKTDDESDIII